MHPLRERTADYGSLMLLNARPVSSLELCMDNDSIWVAFGLSLGANLCVLHQCEHGLSCKWSQGRHSRHATINDILHRSLVSAKISSHLEPSGLSHSDGRRPEGMSMVSWISGKLLVWDATCSDTYALSNIEVAVTGAGAVAEKSEQHICKYSHLDS